jgi:hypothetical protein
MIRCPATTFGTILGRGWRTGCRACTGRTCRKRRGHATGRAPCATRVPPRTCQCRNSRTPAPIRGAVSDDAVEGSEQYIDLALPAIEPLRDHDPVRRILGAKWERVDPSEALPWCKASAKSSLDAGGKSGSAPWRSSRGALSRSPRGAPGPQQTARRAGPVAGQCGSAPTPSDPKRRRVAHP